MAVTDIWGSADYAPTAARLEPAAHVVAGWVAEHAEPGARVVEIGRERCPEAAWMPALGESTGLPDASCDIVASNFGAFLCDPVAGGSCTPRGTSGGSSPR